MKKFTLAIFFVLISVFSYSQNISTDKTPILNFGLSKGFHSMSSVDKGNFGVWLSLGRFEWEIYIDLNNYDELTESLGEYYTDYYKTHAGTSYTKISKEKWYGGAVGNKFGYIFNEYFSVGIVWEMSGSYDIMTSEDTYLSTIHEGWHECSSTYNSKDNFGIYGKLSYPFYVGKNLSISPFISAQIVTSKNNFISIGIMLCTFC